MAIKVHNADDIGPLMKIARQVDVAWTILQRVENDLTDLARAADMGIDDEFLRLAADVAHAQDIIGLIRQTPQNTGGTNGND